MEGLFVLKHDIVKERVALNSVVVTVTTLYKEGEERSEGPDAQC